MVFARSSFSRQAAQKRIPLRFSIWSREQLHGENQPQNDVNYYNDNKPRKTVVSYFLENLIERVWTHGTFVIMRFLLYFLLDQYIQRV